MGDTERRGGRVHGARPFLTACLNRECKPRNRTNGPRPPSNERVRQMNQGLWQCTGQWATEAKSSRALPHSPASTLRRSASDTLAKVGSHENSMQAWTDARLPELKRGSQAHHGWMRCHSQSVPAGSAEVLGPDLVEPSFTRQTLASTAGAAVKVETRKAHGYIEPGILRRPGSYDKIPMGFAGTSVERSTVREERFLGVRQGHEIDVGRSTDRDTRFLGAAAPDFVDVRRSN
jgi:hypothetical protein